MSKHLSDASHKFNHLPNFSLKQSTDTRYPYANSSSFEYYKLHLITCLWTELSDLWFFHKQEISNSLLLKHCSIMTSPRHHCTPQLTFKKNKPQNTQVESSWYKRLATLKSFSVQQKRKHYSFQSLLGKKKRKKPTKCHHKTVKNQPAAITYSTSDKQK